MRTVVVSGTLLSNVTRVQVVAFVNSAILNHSQAWAKVLAEDQVKFVLEQLYNKCSDEIFGTFS